MFLSLPAARRERPSRSTIPLSRLSSTRSRHSGCRSLRRPLQLAQPSARPILTGKSSSDGLVTTDLHKHLQATLGETYTVERELGGGGMSRVFVARDETLGRLVVVKVL